MITWKWNSRELKTLEDARRKALELTRQGRSVKIVSSSETSYVVSIQADIQSGGERRKPAALFADTRPAKVLSAK